MTPSAPHFEAVLDDRLRAAIKTRDSWWPTLVSGPLANQIVGVLRRYPGVHPNHVTVVGMLTAMLAAACLSLGVYPATAAGAVLVQIAFTLDCVDGQLARYRGQASVFGEILDRVFDRIKPPMYLLALAWGARREAPDDLLWLAAFIGASGFLLVDFYRQQYLFLVGTAPKTGDLGSTPPVAAPLRTLDLPFVRLNGGDHYFLISLLCLLDRSSLVVFFVAFVALAQILFRPLYYLQAFRKTFGRWPWRDS